MSTDNNVLESFFVKLGWKIDKDSERKFDETIKSVAKAAQNLSLTLGGLAIAASAAVAKVASVFDTLYFVSQRTGASVQNLRGLQHAFGQLGGSSDQATAAIENFTRNLRTNPGVEKFVNDLGIATRQGGKARDSVDVLLESIDEIKRRNPYYVGAQYAELLGIDEHSFYLLSKKSDQLKEYKAEYDRIAKSIGLDNEEAAKAGASFQRSLTSLLTIITAVAQKLLIDLAPALERLMKALLAWFEAHPQEIAEFFASVARGVDNFARALENGELAKALNEVGDKIFRISKALEEVLGLVNKLGLSGSGNSLLGNIFTHLFGGKEDIIRRGEEDLNAQRESEKPGIVRRGYNWLRRKLGLGDGDASGEASDASGGVTARRQRGDNIVGARESYDFWRSKGLTHEQAAGLVGMEQGESQFNPRSVGDGGLAHGAFQHHPDRRAKILAGTGIDISTATHQQQLEATYWEMTKGQEKGFFDRVKKAKTPGEAAALGVYLFERPKFKDQEAQIRGQYANRWAEQFSDATKMGQSTAAPKPENPNASRLMPILPGFAPKSVLNWEEFNSRFNTAPPMGSSVSNSTTNDNRSISLKTDVHLSGSGSSADVQRLEGAMNRANSNSLRDAQTAIR